MKVNQSECSTDSGGMMISPRQLAQRWGVSVSTAGRFCKKAGIPTYFLGEGDNGTVRYPLRAIVEFEESRRA